MDRRVGTVFLVLAVAGCQPDAVAQPRGKGKGPRPAKVVVAKAAPGQVEAAWVFPGEAKALARASLAVGADGSVESVKVRVGDRFRRGAVLLEVDRALASARLGIAAARVNAAREALAQAEREVKRLEPLPAGVVAEQEREQAASRVATARAELGAREAERAEASAQLRRHRIRAPFDGVVATRFVDRGDWVRVGDPVLEVVSSGGVEILVDASQELLGRVAVGDLAVLVGSERPLRVAGLVPALDPNTRTLRVRLEPEASADLLPGTSVEVRFDVVIKKAGAVVVPQDALLFDGQRSRVVKVVDGKATSVDVSVLAKAGETALVRANGLAVDDQVIVRGNERVRPGQPLIIEDS